MNDLNALLKHAADTVPYYRDSHGRAHAELDDFPLLGKRHYIENLESLLSTDYAGYEQTSDTARWNDPRVLACEFTSGSSGYPLRCYKTSAERTRLGLSLFKKRKAIDPEFRPQDLFCFIHNTDTRSHSYIDSLGNLAEENIARILTHLRDEIRPAALHANTMLLLYYADFIRTHDFDLKRWHIRFIESVSESISDEQKQYIGECFQSEVFNCYGCLECYNLAYECPQHALHINENVLLEVCDPDRGTLQECSSQQGEIVLTSLVNRAQPFIRYKTGDLGTIRDADCPCGSPAKIVQLSGKRKIDYIKLLYATKDRRLNICGYDVFATVMHRLANESRDDVSWYNVVQTDFASFDVLYSRKHTFSSEFCQLFKMYAEEELGQPAEFTFIEKDGSEVLAINRKNRVFKSLLQEA